MKTTREIKTINKQQIIELIEKTIKENWVSKQRPDWGVLTSQVDIFNQGMEELGFRLKRVLSPHLTNQPHK